MPFLIEKCQKEEGRFLKIEYRIQARAAIDLFELIAPSFLSENRKRPKGQSKESEDITMIDSSEKSRKGIYREKKEGELRLAKQKESEWKRRKDKERKCMIGGTF